MSDSATAWTVTHQIPLSMEFSKQEHWNGLPLPTAVDLPNPGIKTVFPALASRFLTTVLPGKSITELYGQSDFERNVSFYALKVCTCKHWTMEPEGVLKAAQEVSGKLSQQAGNCSVPDPIRDTKNHNSLPAVIKGSKGHELPLS